MTENPTSPQEGAASGVAIQPKQLEPVTPDIISLSHGQELSESEATALSRSRFVKWIVIAGPVSCGKTTLLTSLYELFQWGPVGDVILAGSNTLPALEQRCFLSRVASEKETPDTQRTRYKEGDEPTYLHMRTCKRNGRNHLDLLFTDVSGELYEHVRDSTDSCRELACLRRASNFVLLLDSEKAISPERRWAMVEDAKSLLLSCVDSEMLSKDCVVNVVWSKVDFFEGAEKASYVSFKEDVARRFQASFANRIQYLKFSETAARPIRALKLGFGYGVQPLLLEWVDSSATSGEIDVIPRSNSGARESEKYGTRYFAES